MIYLTDMDLQGLGIAPPEIADAVEAALGAKAGGRLHVAPKAALLPGEARYMMATLAVGNDEDLTVLKVATVSPDNPSRGLPSINATIMVLDARTGRLSAVMDANWITAVRTAALSVVAARRMADPGSQTLAFVGTGVQARSHLDAFAAEFPLTGIRAFGRGSANLEALCGKAHGMGLAAQACDDPREAVEGADLVVTSVTLDHSIEPFLDAAWLKPGAFAAVTDLSIPWGTSGMAGFGSIVVDDLEQEAASETKLAPPDTIAGDLTDLVAGRLTEVPDRSRPSAFAFRGIALGDYAAAALVLRRAEAADAGTALSG